MAETAGAFVLFMGGAAVVLGVVIVVLLVVIAKDVKKLYEQSSHSGQ